MNSKLAWLVLALAVSAHAKTLPPTPPAPLQPLPVQSETTVLVKELLTRYHYRPVELDDTQSAKIFDTYLKRLDPERLFFLQSDIDQFSKSRLELDDAILKRDLTVPFAIFNRNSQRIFERISEARKLLAQGFDFSSKEEIQLDRSEAPWPANEEEARDLWRKRVKNDWLRLKLAGKSDSAIRETLDKRYENTLKRLTRYKSSDAFEIFMDSFSASVEPHTDYLGPRAAEDFAISMRLSLVGIGASLQERDEYTVVRELIAGGPAAKSGKLSAGDRIVGVGQGEGKPIKDVVGWRIDDVVAQIRGTKNTPVVLEILPAGNDTKTRRITLIRDTINLENQAASKAILNVGTATEPRRIGIITLPAFYQDFDGRNRGDQEYRSASRDMARLLKELKAEKVEAVLVDLRNNGGGALDEAVKTTGLFIDQGPVVQQRDFAKRQRVEYDRDAGVAWDGPLAVLINRSSASASEIFAAAIQDYGRGIILGEQSFGKGTVQTLANLRDLIPDHKTDHGELKMTTAQFFRIDGGTTQLKGVVPDVPLIALSDTKRFGESALDNPMPWTKISPADYTPAGRVADLVPQLQAKHQARAAQTPRYKELEEDAAELAKLRERKTLSLNEAERRREMNAQEARRKAREASNPDTKTGDAKGPEAAATGSKRKDANSPRFQDDGLLAEERSLDADIKEDKAAKVENDVILNEAARVLADEAELLRATPALAQRGTPRKNPPGSAN